MPLLTRFFSRNTLKEEACHWNRTDLNLKKLDELLAQDKVKDGAVLYLNTSRSLLGKGVDFLSTREHTTSHSLLTPRGCSAETARRLEHTLTAQFADRYYGPEAEEARQYVLNAIAQHRQVVKSPQFAQAIHTLAHAKEMPRPTGPAQVASLQSTSHPAQPNTVPAGQAIGPDGCPVPLTIDLRGVNFDFDKANLRPDAVAILEEASAILNAHPDMRVEVAGHTDAIGTAQYNQGLSERRARAVYDYLTSHGVDASRISGPNGYGEARPIAPNTNADGSDNPEGRARNRRTELNVQN